MKIQELEIENYKGIKSLNIKPKKNLIEVTGWNGEGKSSVIESIWDALQHREAAKQNSEPIRKWADKASVEIDFGEYKVERTFTENGSYLRLKDEMGKIWSAQSRIDAWLGDVSFDPSKFLNMKNSDRKETLLKVWGVEDKVAEIDEEYDEIYEERRMVGREKKNLKGTLENYDTEVAQIDIDEKVETEKLRKKLEEIEEIEDKKKELENQYEKWEKYMADQKEDIQENEDEIERLQKKIKNLKNENKERKQNIKKAKTKNKDIAKKIEKKKEKLKDKNKDKIWKQINEAEEINEKYRKKQEYDKVYRKYQNKKEKYNNMTDQIEELREKKKNLINEVDLNEDLNVKDWKLYMNGKPFDQLNTAKKLKVSLKIGSMINPKIKVIRIEDGNSFDKENMELIKEFAEELNYQIWIERIVESNTDNQAIKIKAGEIK